MDALKAIEVLSLRGDQVAQSLGVDEGPGWRDNTGTAHLYIRGALQSLERIANNQHSAEAAAIAIGTVAFANKSPDGFLGDHSSEAAKIAMKILQTEMAGGAVSDAVRVADVDLLSKDLQTFSDNIKGQSMSMGADKSLEAFSSALEAANTHY
ncbi:MAG: hypothetical protein ACK4VI_09625 [Alphaproteobacteria bacterium]